MNKFMIAFQQEGIVRKDIVIIYKSQISAIKFLELIQVGFPAE